MNKVKILHCGDLHFDTPFKELNKDVSTTSKNELLEVFKNIIDIVIREKVQVMLIAGDVFDNLTVNKNTLFFICNELERISDIPVFIAPGNHDPYGEKSFYKLIGLPKNVYVFKGSMEFKEIKELNLVVWGAGFNKNYERDTLFKDVVVDDSKINIMVIHGDIANGNSSNEYNPIYINDISKSKIDYIALGHRHEFSQILKEDKTSYAYCGCPQGRGFDETGDKGVILGDVFIGGTSLNFIPTYKRKYIIKEINISECNTYDEVIRLILNTIDHNEREHNFYKIILMGDIKEHLSLNENVLLEKLKDKFYYIKLVNNTNVAIDLDKISRDFSIKGKFVSKIMKLLENSNDDNEKEILNMALKLGVQCLSQEEVNLNDY